MEANPEARAAINRIVEGRLAMNASEQAKSSGSSG
jgi:hypothetical protein